MANIKINKKELDKFSQQSKAISVDFKSLPKKLQKNLPKKLLSYLENNTPKDTGETAKSWHVNKTNDGFEIINDRGGIIQFLFKGVKSHLIEPKDKSVLVIELPGSVIFTKFVNHPGFPKQMDQNKIFKEVKRLINQEAEKIVISTLKAKLK